MTEPIGLNHNKVVLVPHNPYWSALYATEAAVLVEIFGDEMLSINHFGSTAIRWIKAKPVIDIVVQIKSDPEKLDQTIIDRLTEHTYRERVFNDGLARRMFPKGPDDYRTHHVHVLKDGHPFAKNMLLFRDRLCADKSLAKEYETLKTELSIKHPDDSQMYYKAKISFFESVLK